MAIATGGGGTGAAEGKGMVVAVVEPEERGGEVSAPCTGGDVGVEMDGKKIADPMEKGTCTSN